MQEEHLRTKNWGESLTKVLLLIALVLVLLVTSCVSVFAFTTYATVDSSGITVSNISRGLHDSSYIASGQFNDPGTGAVPRSYSVELALADPLFLQGCRSDMDLFNVALWYGNGSLIFRTAAEYPLNSFRQIEIHINNTAYCASRGVKVWTMEGVPSNMTVNDSKCSYGTTTPHQVTCAPTNWTLAANATYQFLVKVGAGPGGPYEYNTVVACWNEPYNGNFFEDNATYIQREADIIAGCKEWQTELRRLSPNTRTMSPSFTTAPVCCQTGESMFKNFTRNTTGIHKFDYYDLHLYQYNGAFSTTTYFARFSEAMSLAANESVKDRLVVTESAWENTTTGSLNPIGVTGAAYSSSVSSAWMRAWALGVLHIDPYRWGCGGNASTQDCTAYYNTMVYNTYTTGVTTPAYDALNFTTPLTYGMDGASLYNASTGNSSTYVWFVKKNSTYGRLGVWNVNNATLVLQNVTITGNNVTSVTSYYNGSSQTLNANQSINLSTIEAYGVHWFEVNMNVACSGLTGTPVYVFANNTGQYESNSACLTSGIDPNNGKKCNSAGVCV